MARNIEIKARVHDLEQVKKTAVSLSDIPCETLQQEDTFFNTPQGRLKLRQITTYPDCGWLIYYERTNQAGPKLSNYVLTEVGDPETLKIVLTGAYGIRGVVHKIRYLYLAGTTRIHVDQVEGLGDFIELEVALEDRQSPVEGQQIAQDLMQKLGVSEADLIESAYMDMLEQLN